MLGRSLLFRLDVWIELELGMWVREVGGSGSTSDDYVVVCFSGDVCCCAFGV